MNNAGKVIVIFILLIVFGIEAGLLLSHFRILKAMFFSIEVLETSVPSLPDNLLTFTVCSLLGAGITGLFLLKSDRGRRRMNDMFFELPWAAKGSITFIEGLGIALFAATIGPVVLLGLVMVMEFFPAILGLIISEFWGIVFINAFRVLAGVFMGFAVVKVSFSLVVEDGHLTDVRYLSLVLVSLAIIELQILLVETTGYLPDPDNNEVLWYYVDGTRRFFPFLCCGIVAGWAFIFFWKKEQLEPAIPMILKKAFKDDK